MSAEQLKQIREKLGDALEECHNTDFHLTRLLKGQNFNIEKTAAKYIDYQKNRNALGFTSKQSVEDFLSSKNGVKGKYYRIAKLGPHVFNEKDNCLVFLEMSIKDSAEHMKCVSTQEYLEYFFAYCELVQIYVLEREAKTGQKSGGICVFDMENMETTPYLNPTSAVNRLMKSRISVWLDYYAELLQKVIIANPPFILRFSMKIVNILLPESVRSRFFVGNEYLTKYLASEVIPGAFGGVRPLMDGETANGTMSIPDYCEKDYQIAGTIFQSHGLDSPNEECFRVGANELRIFEYPAESATHILYEYTASDGVQVWMEQDGIQLSTNFVVCTPVISEQRRVAITTPDAVIKLHVKNASNKKNDIKLAVALVEK